MRDKVKVVTLAVVCATLTVFLSVSSAFAQSQAKPAVVPKKYVAEIIIKGAVGERPPAYDFMESRDYLWDLVARMEKAGADKSLSCVSLVINHPALSYSKAIELESSIKRLRKAGKKVYVFSEFFSLPTYMLATAADEVVMPESGMLLINGLRGELYMWKGLLDILGIQAEFVKIGEFKSAGEPFTLEQLTPGTRAMYDLLMDDLYGEIVARIAVNRKLSESKVKQLIDKGLYDGSTALKAGLVDRNAFLDGFRNGIKQKAGGKVAIKANYGKKKHKQLNLSGNPFALLAAMFAQPGRPAGGKPVIAIVVATGPIVPGETKGSFFYQPEMIASSSFLKTLKKIQKHKNIKAVVVRIDSPGGSASASDVIWAALREVGRKIPVIISMGNVAASGGYYIACAGHHIVAEPSTVTGSIGVISGKFNLKSMYDKIGLRKEIFSRGANAGLFSDYGPINDGERAAITGLLQTTYERFFSRIMSGRKITAEKLETVAGGRVWSGKRALEIGLVDELGGIADAVERAAERAQLKPGGYAVVLYPETKSFSDLFAKGFKINASEMIRNQIFGKWAWLGGLIQADPVLALPDFLFELK